MVRRLHTDLSSAEVVFSAIGGLRGAISLILAQMVVTEHRPGEASQNSRVIAQVPLAPCSTSLKATEYDADHKQHAALP